MGSTEDAMGVTCQVKCVHVTRRAFLWLCKENDSFITNHKKNPHHFFKVVNEILGVPFKIYQMFNGFS